MNRAKDQMPRRISPQLATLVSVAPEGKTWLHEIKFDGYRFICFVNEGKVKWVTRNQNDWSHKFSSLTLEIKKLKLTNAIFDGEIVVVNEKNKFDFQLLQNSLKEENASDFMYYVFDLLYYNGEDLTQKPLLARKEILNTVIKNKKNSKIQYSSHVIGDGNVLHQKCCELGYEGIVSKKITSLYEQTRTKNWQKVKCSKRQEFLICGYTPPEGHRKNFGALLLGVYTKDKKLIYCGNVGTGFSDETLDTLYKEFKKYKTSLSPFSKFTRRLTNVSWLKPKLIGEVEFSEWTAEGHLRHPSFKGLRFDKKPEEVIKE